MKKKAKIGRPFKEDKKQAISVKLPPYLINWMERQKEKRPELIETALTSYYKIPEERINSGETLEIELNEYEESCKQLFEN